jgi:RNA polymerase sigma-70 factor (ECF subfamily)
MDGDKPAATAFDKEQIERWIEEARSGSSPALGELLEACRNYLAELAFWQVPSALKCKCSPSDLVQETSLDAHRDFVNFRGQRLEELLAWLRRILVHNAGNANRHYETAGKRQASREVPLELYPAIAAELKDDILSPRSMLVESEEVERITSALDRLSADHRRVILLRNREHYSFVEIGIQMDRSADAVRKLWFRAVERLQLELLEPDDNP